MFDRDRSHGWIRFVSMMTFSLSLAVPPLFAGEGVKDSEPSQEVTLDDAWDMYMEGDYAHAIRAYERLLNQPDRRVEAGLGLARCRMQIGDYEAGVKGLNELDAPNSAARHTLLGRLLRRTGSYQQAIQHARSAIQADTNSAAAHLLLADTLEELGRREEAIEAYRWFDAQIAKGGDLPRDAAWITAAALGFLRYSLLTRTNVASRTKHVLNRMLQVAYERVDRGYWPARIAAADLLREKYNNDEHDGSVSDYEAALRLNRNLPQAYTGLGEVALASWQFETVEDYARKALKINPNYAEAIHLLGKKFILERRYDQAVKTLDRALAINARDLRALSIRAAAYACLYDDTKVKEIAGRIRRINPRCALFHRTMGDALGGIRQYAASERAYRRAIDLDETDANARTELGMMYMQWGDEAKAREALEGAWALDPFNERTKFTLDLLEMIEKFAQTETPHFIVKTDPDADPGLGDFIAGYMEGIYDSVTQDYDTTLSSKTTIELFPTHRAFGVRITGKPWIHTVGAATGRVIALAAPRETNRFGRYDLARVLKHEFTHTVTLEATANRIPHWFTEGLAVMQEDAPRPLEWWQLLTEAMRHDRLFTLESIDWGFIRPQRPNDRQMAYAQSEWMCEYLVERFGYDVVNKMLDRYKNGQTQEEVFRDQLGVSLEMFAADFKKWARVQATGLGFDLTPAEEVEPLIQRADAEPENAALFGRLARAVLDAGDTDRALQLARRSLELDSRELNGLSVLARTLYRLSHQERNESARRSYDEEAKPALERLLERDPDHWVAIKYAAEIALRDQDTKRATELYQRLQSLCPMDPASWGGLAGVYLKEDKEDLALPQLLELARLETNDADIPIKIAELTRRSGRLREARYWYRRALYLDPYRAKTHKALGDVSMQLNDLPAALSAYRMLTQLEPNRAEHFERAAVAAHKLKKDEEARAFARRAVELNPHSPVRSLLP